MLSNGIQSSIQQLIEAQLPKGTTNASGLDAKNFQALLEPIVAQLSAAVEAAVAKATSASSVTGNATQPLSSLTTRDPRLSSSAASLLRNPDLPMFEQLSNDLTAGDPQYNQRESLMRDRLDLGEMERRLQDSARSLGVAYDKSDLDGVLRNAGYDAAHLGSSERYMNAIEKFMGEAYKNYQQRATNKDGLQA